MGDLSLFVPVLPGVVLVGCVKFLCTFLPLEGRAVNKNVKGCSNGEVKPRRYIGDADEELNRKMQRGSSVQVNRGRRRTRNYNEKEGERMGSGVRVKNKIKVKQQECQI